METTCSRRHHTSGSFYLIYFCFPIPMNIYSVCHFLYFPSYLNIYLLITSSQHGGEVIFHVFFPIDDLVNPA